MKVKKEASNNIKKISHQKYTKRLKFTYPMCCNIKVLAKRYPNGLEIFLPTKSVPVLRVPWKEWNIFETKSDPIKCTINDLMHACLTEIVFKWNSLLKNGLNKPSKFTLKPSLARYRSLLHGYQLLTSKKCRQTFFRNFSKWWLDDYIVHTIIFAIYTRCQQTKLFESKVK